MQKYIFFSVRPNYLLINNKKEGMPLSMHDYRKGHLEPHRIACWA